MHPETGLIAPTEDYQMLSEPAGYLFRVLMVNGRIRYYLADNKEEAVAMEEIFADEMRACAEVAEK